MQDKLALFGGKKTRREPYPPYPVIGEEEKKGVLDVLNDGRLSTFIASAGTDFLGGKRIKELERLFCEYHNTKYAVSFNSATAALHAAIVACGVDPGEEIITTPYTFTSTATSAFMHNAVPVFADIKPDTFNIDPEEIKKKISHLTKAIIPVHLFGNPVDIDEVVEIAIENNLKVIEDCAQAPGAKYKNKLVGTIGDCGIFSLTENKNITSGEGGILITNNEEIAEVARLIRNHGEAVVSGQKKRSYKSTILGWNYRMTEVDAAIGIEQLKKFPNFAKKRNKNFKDLYEIFSKYSDKFILPRIIDKVEPCWFGFPITIKENSGFNRKDFIEFLERNGIQTRLIFTGNILYHPAYKQIKHRIASDLTNTEIVFRNSFFLGVYPGIQDEHLNYIENVIEKFIKMY